MQINIKCADCGRPIGSFVRLGVGKKDVEIEIHGCFHIDIYDHIKELKAEIVKLKTQMLPNEFEQNTIEAMDEAQALKTSDKGQ